MYFLSCSPLPLVAHPADPDPQITCLYDMDIPRPDNFNETYLYEGMSKTRFHKT
jgi:hypothetical protein